MTGPVIRYSAPGRVNLIGEHTDYNLGLALPIALPVRTSVTLRPDACDALEVHSDRVPGSVRIALNTVPGDVTGWAAYVAGVVWALRRAGKRVPGGVMSISGGVDMGSGLASSAALECAVLGAMLAATGELMDPLDRARIAQRAENEYVGTPTGLLDQTAVLCAESRRALLVDFRDLTTRPVPFDPEAYGLALLLINSRAVHRHADGEYATRRAACERAAAALGVSSLREVQGQGISVLSGVPDPVDARRARHVLTENVRVHDMVVALQACDYRHVGGLLSASHDSMRDDFEITTAHLDLIVDTAVHAGALGARMTGGGFGGCVIALVDGARSGVVSEAVRETVRRAGHPAPSIVATQAGPGAGEHIS
ncbi:galactokinase [Mycolicibacterium confluentis]|uniref:Galactokinase n=1 Tax=Mycolicibacterium confluentis TaxID=28047 RepID=A0A7I7Y0C4_9MYCO|nr:galactokinase [Mycolicibacterium confluentis]MCV7320043.1 galactokinase [Mycolicibacterium confluentis]ORV34591.1 galactokinase [Mycolicibacterium confluentis]BBZ35078.1 galactokinase [Mycolicibacterium confluentis]